MIEETHGPLGALFLPRHQFQAGTQMRKSITSCSKDNPIPGDAVFSTYEQKLLSQETVGLTANMALEVVRSAVKLDHIYAKEDEDISDLGKDVILSEAIDSLVSILVKTCVCLRGRLWLCRLSTVKAILLSTYYFTSRQHSYILLISCLSFVLYTSNIKVYLHEKINKFLNV